MTTALTGTVSDTRVGGLFGFGAEYAFMPRWTAKMEYNYMDFGKERYNVPVTASMATGKPRLSLVRLPTMGVPSAYLSFVSQYGYNSH